MHPELMFVQDVKVLYNTMLSDESTLVSLKIQVLKNLQTYLQDEDTRMQTADRECEFFFFPNPRCSVSSVTSLCVCVCVWE